jgi:NAD(P)-dependent dehydrogenase (short-subunit alcohol dehydrogenase family)
MDGTRHQGRRALVSGAGSGIGRATVLRLLAEGATVLGFDRDEDGLAQLVHEAADERLEVVPVDVTVEADVASLVEGDGPIDILINNAGIMDHFVPLAELDDQLWDQVVGINLTGVMRVTRTVLPVMVAQESGSIVTVASKGALTGGVSGAAYAAAKHGVLGLVRHVAWFYSPNGIRSNAVCPGAVATGIGASAMPRSEWALARAQTAMGAIGGLAEADEIAAAISWLASSEASNVNGAVVPVDGGWGAA